MSNNKQSSVEWYIIERHTIEIQSRLGLISPIEYDAKLIKIEEQAKAMHKEEVLSFDTLLHKHEMEALNNNTILLTKEEFYNETFGE